MKFTLLTTTTLLALSGTIEAGKFMSTCTNVYLIATSVGGSCKRANGSRNNASIDANGYVGNRNGFLVRNSDGKGAWKGSSIDLILSNQNGVLAWDR
ncbi:hypothetical protein TWF281_002792 [Arthrobotrys megalospora]